MVTAAVNINAGQISANAYGVSVSSAGGINIDGLVNSVMGYLDSKAPNFVKALLNSAADVGATTLALDAAIAGAVYALPAELGVTVAALGPFAPVAAVVMAVPVLLMTLDPASGGTGCCGTAPMTREDAIDQLRWQRDPLNLDGQSANYMPPESSIRNLMLYSGQGANAAPCDPSQYAWPDFAAPPAGTAEAFIDSVIKAAYEQTTGCWSYMSGPEYATILAAAIGTWNRAHASEPVTIVSRKVNTTQTHPAVAGGFSAYTQGGQPEATDPISVAMNYAAIKYDAKGQGQGFLVPAGATATFTVHGNADSPIVAGVVSKSPIVAGISKGLAAVGFHLDPSTLLQGKPAMNAVSAIQVSPASLFGLAPADQALMTVAAPAAPAPAPSAATSFFSKPLVGKVTYGEAGIGAAAVALVTKLMRVW